MRTLGGVEWICGRRVGWIGYADAGGGGLDMRTPGEGEMAWLPAPIPEC